MWADFEFIKHEVLSTVFYLQSIPNFYTIIFR